MFISVDGKVVSTLSGPAPQGYLLGGRVCLYDTPPEGDKEADLTHTISALMSLQSEIKNAFVGREELVDAVTTAISSAEHLFVLGPPGTAKSSLLRMFAEGINGRFFRIVLNPDTTRESLLGPIDPVALKHGFWTRKWASLATSDIAFLDEIWKASPQVQNILLDVLEERRVTEGSEEFSVPLITAMAASNEVPDNKESRAIYDRFLIRLSVSYINDPQEFKKLFISSAGYKPIKSKIDPLEINLLAGVVEYLSMNPPKELIEAITELWMTFQKNGMVISDRRWRKTLKLAIANAFLKNETPSPRHLSVARWTLWTNPEEEQDVRNEILALTDPVAGKVLEMEALLSDLRKQAQNLDQADIQTRAEVTGNARRLQKMAQDLLKDPNSNSHKDRIQIVIDETQKIISEVLDLMAKGGN